jgi:hypothetical protein
MFVNPLHTPLFNISHDMPIPWFIVMENKPSIHGAPYSNSETTTEEEMGG